MFNHKLSLFNFKQPRARNHFLPVDFGSMYFLYPTENSYTTGFRSTGIFNKLFDGIKTKLHRKQNDVSNFTKDFF
jgi:hypothetical protein